MQADFEEATAEAEELVAETTGLRSLSGPARARVTDRAGWVGANVASFQRLLKPITDKLGDKMEGSRTGGLVRRAAGLPAGLLRGWVPGRARGRTQGRPGGEE